MKKLVTLIIVVCSCLLISCSKEQVDSTNLEGTWRTNKGELLFNGKVVNGGDDSVISILSLTFSEGYASMCDKEGVERFPYTYSNGVITMLAGILPVQLVVKKLTKSELTIEFPIPNLLSDLSDGEYYASYRDQHIYCSEGYILGDTYWYVSGGEVVVCEPIDEEDPSAGWYDTSRIYLKKY